MNHTPEIKRAIQFAARKHHGQFRKESEPLPYITHPFSTALLVAETGADDETVIAALLHDTLEDTDTTEEEITGAFGRRVANIVIEVTEPADEVGHVLEWKERKKMYLAQIELGSEEALIVAMADKIDNIESRLEGFKHEGLQFSRKWSQSEDSYLWFYGAVLHIAEEKLPKHPLTKRLREAYRQEQKVFTKP
jgi:(p)ppGpp synthase/HD superfamily hydrolase